MPSWCRNESHTERTCSDTWTTSWRIYVFIVLAILLEYDRVLRSNVLTVLQMIQSQPHTTPLQHSNNWNDSIAAFQTADKSTLVLLRHGESTWNLENKFTGWVDVPLSPKGHEETIEAGRVIKESGIVPDCAFTSLQKRAIRTLDHVLEETDLMWIPVNKSWKLNER